MIKRTSTTFLLVLGISLAGSSVKLNGVLYPRYTYGAMESGFELMGAEGDIQAQVTGKTRDILTAMIQIRAGGAMSGWTKGFHFGEAYALFPLGLSLPTIRVGQAVIPFGLLADYDIHTQIIQTPFAWTRACASIRVLASWASSGILTTSFGCPTEMDRTRWTTTEAKLSRPGLRPGSFWATPT